MKLSDDGKRLIRVSNEDIKNGTFNIPEGVAIGDWAFSGCTSLTHLTLPEGVTISHEAFQGCTSLTHLTIPEGVAIGDAAFMDCTSLTHLTIPEGVAIGSSAFEGCTSLTHVTLPEGVAIGFCAFRNCTSLAHLTIPEGVAIGDLAFDGCTSLANIVVNTNNEDEITRIKELLPDNLKDRVIPNLVWKEVVDAQKNAYERVLNEPKVSGLFGIHENLGLISDVLPNITDLEGQDNLALQQIQARIRTLPIPTSQDGLEQYKQDVMALAGQVKRDLIAETDAAPTPEKILAEKLNKYVVYLKDLIGKKEERHPGFFQSDPVLNKSLDTQIDAVIRLINHLNGDESISFSKEDKEIFNKKDTFLGKTLSTFGIKPDDLPVSEGPNHRPS